jgi:hypothetical protein
MNLPDTAFLPRHFLRLVMPCVVMRTYGLKLCWTDWVINGVRPIEMCVVLAGFAISSLLTYSTIEMVHFSIVFNDMTQGLIPIPLWIPQMGMLLGVTMLSFAFLVDAITLWRGGTPSYMRDKTGGTS